MPKIQRKHRDDPIMSIGQRVWQLRHEHTPYLSQRALADEIGVHWRGIGELENHPERGCNSWTLIALCKRFRVSADWLLGLTDVRVPAPAAAPGAVTHPPPEATRRRARLQRVLGTTRPAGAPGA